MGGANWSKCMSRITNLEFAEVPRSAHDEREIKFSKLGGTAQLRPCMKFHAGAFLCGFLTGSSINTFKEE